MEISYYNIVDKMKQGALYMINLCYLKQMKPHIWQNH